MIMKNLAYASVLGASLLAPAFAAEQAAVDPNLAQFRAAYTSGEGLAYVVISDERGEHIYRYGDASRLTAKKDTDGNEELTKAFWSEETARGPSKR